MKAWLKSHILEVVAILLLSSFGVFVSQSILAQQSAIDFVEGQKIPAKLIASHYFEPETKTASFTVAEDDNFYLINSSGGAITATLPTPSTMPTGKCWGAILTTAGNAVTFSAGTYSIDGATSTNAMDAAGDSYIFCNNGSGYYFLSRYIH